MFDVCSGDQTDRSVVFLFWLDPPPTAENDWKSDGECKIEVERVDAQLVVYAFDEEENLVLLDSELVARVWLGLVVVGGLEDGEVGFWVVGHVEGRCQVEVTVAI